MRPAADATSAAPQLPAAALRWLPLAAAIGALALAAVRLAEDGWRPPVLWLLAMLLGATLYHASFGFAGAYRRMIVARDMRGVQAQLLLLAVATVLFAPVLSAGAVFGHAIGGAWAPVGVSVVAGAFLFGIGMQLAGGCGSGTLYTAGGGNPRMLLGWDPSTSAFWQSDFQSTALAGGVMQDTTSLMDLGIMLGALCAAALAGRFSPQWRMPWRSLAAALIGGLAIGYGARIAYGCNIGAFVSGVASGSLHGWLWIAAALPGTWIGVRLRPVFGLAN